MRKIRFRGKRADNNKWVYGLYEETPTCCLNPPLAGANIRTDSSMLYPIDSGTLGQFTGLYDKNGKEIFEGDVCKGNGYCSETDEKFIIKYGKYKTDDWKEKYSCNEYQYGWYAEFINLKSQVHLVTPNGIEVIGNIFDDVEGK